nr:MAG TPA: hypothetical protein [Caudoviricetes sp.]
MKSLESQCFQRFSAFFKPIWNVRRTHQKAYKRLKTLKKCRVNAE